MGSRIRQKRLYGKPQLTQISISPEEAALTNCKHATGSTGNAANKCLDVALCKAVGS